MDAKLSTPFEHSKQPEGMKGDGVYDHNPVPSVGKPADIGKGDISLKFAENIQANKAALDTPLQSGMGIENANPQQSRPETSGVLSTSFENKLSGSKD